MFCKKCGKEIESSAAFCPACGNPVNSFDESTGATKKAKKKKKKHPILGAILVVLGLLLIAAVASGGGEPEKVGEASTNNTTAQLSNKRTEFSVGDVVEQNDISVTLVDVIENKGSSYNKPADGNVFVLFEFNIENNSSKDIAVSSIMCFEAYVDDYAANMSLSAQLTTDKNQLDGTVAAGKKMNGVIGYEVSENFKEIEIRFTPNFWSGKDIIFTYTK